MRHRAPPEFGRSVNLIHTKGGRLCPSYYCQPPRIKNVIYTSELLWRATFHVSTTKCIRTSFGKSGGYWFFSDLAWIIFMNWIIKFYLKWGFLNHFRFIPPQNVFAPPEENPDNECFCLVEEGCNVPRGLFNMSACQFGSPTMMSWPHFLDVSLFLCLVLLLVQNKKVLILLYYNILQ